MKIIFFIIVNMAVLELVTGNDECRLNDTDWMISDRSMSRLSRKKRFLRFPEGSAFTITISVVKAIQITEPSGWNLALEFDVIWPIPSDPEELFYDQIRRPSPNKRHKRDLYSSIETVLDNQGLPGKDCVLRTICEARSTLSPPGVSFVEDILRIILSNLSENKHDMDEYEVAYRTRRNCDFRYPCPFSILGMILAPDEE